MATPTKAAPPILAALALALAASAAQAGDPAYRSAKNGWSTQHGCKLVGRERRCRTLTRGLSVGNAYRDAVNLMYICNTIEKKEWLSFSFNADSGVDRNDPALPATWRGTDGEHRETIETRVGVYKPKLHKRWVYFYPRNVQTFLNRLHTYDTLEVVLPLRHERPLKVRFKLANAIPSIARTMEACNIKESKLGRLPQ